MFRHLRTFCLHLLFKLWKVEGVSLYCGSHTGEQQMCSPPLPWLVTAAALSWCAFHTSVITLKNGLRIGKQWWRGFLSWMPFALCPHWMMKQQKLHLSTCFQAAGISNTDICCWSSAKTSAWSENRLEKTLLRQLTKTPGLLVNIFLRVSSTSYV